MIFIALLAFAVFAFYCFGRWVWIREGHPQPDRYHDPIGWEIWASESMQEPWVVAARTLWEWGLECAHAARSIAAGVWWNVKRALPHRPKPSQAVALLHQAEAAGNHVVTAQALIGLQNEVGVLVQRGTDRTADETYRLEHVRQQVREYEQRVVDEVEGTAPRRPAIAPLLGAGLIGGIFNPLTRWAIVAAAATSGVAVVQTARLHAVKVEARVDRQALKQYQLDYAAARGRLDSAYTRVTVTQQNCVAQLEERGKELATLKAFVTGQKRRRASDEKTALASGTNVSVGDLLRDIRRDQAAGPPAAAVDNGPAGVHDGSGGDAGHAP